MPVNLFNVSEGYLPAHAAVAFDSALSVSKSALPEQHIMTDSPRSIATEIKAVLNNLLTTCLQVLKSEGGWCKNIVTLLAISSVISKTAAQFVSYNSSHSWLSETDVNITSRLCYYDSYDLPNTDINCISLSDNVTAPVRGLTHSDDLPYLYYAKPLDTTKPALCLLQPSATERLNSSIRNNRFSAKEQRSAFELNFNTKQRRTYLKNSKNPFFITYNNRRQYDHLRKNADIRELNLRIIKLCKENQTRCLHKAAKDLQLAAPEGLIPDHTMFKDMATRFYDNALIYQVLGQTLMEFIADNIKESSFKNIASITSIFQSLKFVQLLGEFIQLSDGSYDEESYNFIDNVIARVRNDLFPFLHHPEILSSPLATYIPLDSPGFKNIHLASLCLKDKEIIAQYTLRQLIKLGEKISNTDKSATTRSIFWPYIFIVSKFQTLHNDLRNEKRSYYSEDVISAVKNKFHSCSVIPAYGHREVLDDNELKYRLFPAGVVSSEAKPALIKQLHATNPNYTHCYVSLICDNKTFFLPLKRVGWQHDKPVFAFIEPETNEVIWHFTSTCNITAANVLTNDASALTLSLTAHIG